MKFQPRGDVGRVTRARRVVASSAALVAIVLTVSACGGSGSDSSSTITTSTASIPAPPPGSMVAIVAQDNKICQKVAPEVADIAPPAFTPQSITTTQLPIAVKYLDQVLPLLKDEHSQITAVGKPTKVTGTQAQLYQSVLSSLNKLLADEQAARDAAASGSVAGFKAALRTQQADSQRLTGLAVQTGLTTCAGG